MDYKDLQSLLELRMKIIEDDDLRESDSEKQLSQLQEVSEKIDAWRDLHRTDLNRRLLHFLDNYSLNKALNFLRSAN